jgi:hypothetical protein
MTKRDANGAPTNRTRNRECSTINCPKGSASLREVDARIRRAMLDPSFERSTNVIPKGVRFSKRGGCPNPDNSFDQNDRDSRNAIPGISPRERKKKENDIDKE